MSSHKQNKFNDIQFYENIKYNLKDSQKSFIDFESAFAEIETAYEGLHCNLSIYLKYSRSTFLSPAYFLNNYLDTLNDYSNKSFNSRDTEIFKSISTITIQNLFIAIKSLLDRLSTIFTYYYPCLSLKITFGRIGDKKPSGLMSLVMQKKENDPLFKYIYEEYTKWIKSAISPRDLVIHYNDMELRESFPADGRTIFLHSEKYLFNYDEYFEYDDFHYYKSLSQTVNKTYTFIFNILGELLKRPLVYTRPLKK